MGELLDLFYAGLVIYFIYKLITGLIMPVSRVSSDMKSKIRAMQEMQEEQLRQQKTAAQNTRTATPKADVSKSGDYIDFEEIK